MEKCCTSRTAGKRNRRVRIEKPSTSASVGNDGKLDLTNDSNWQLVRSQWVSIMTRGGRETRVFDQVQGEVTHVIEMDSNSITRSILPKWRLKMGTRVFQIVAAYDVDDQHKTMRIHAMEPK